MTPLAAAVLRVRPAPERAIVLECGSGDAVMFLAREFPAARIRGIDRSAELVREASARVGLDPEGRVAFKRGGPRSIPYPDELFDLLVAVDSAPPAAESRRVLRPGGHLLLVRTASPQRLQGLANRWLERRLRRQGIELDESTAVGDGSFSVGRLPGEDSPPSAD